MEVYLPSSEENTVHLNWEGHDELFLTYDANKKVKTLKVFACAELTQQIKSIVKNYGHLPLTEWKLPQGSTHGEMLIRELIMRALGTWNPPYQEKELCHCRSITTQAVDRAILQGAHDSTQILFKTGAGAACGTCKVHSDALIQHRMGTSK